jgi:hypothetical protein
MVSFTLKGSAVKNRRGFLFAGLRSLESQG